MDLLSDRRDQDHNIFGEYLGHRTTLDNDDTSLDDFILGEIFEDASEHPLPVIPDQEFWVLAANYNHSELVNRCMQSVLNHDLTSAQPRAHVPMQQDFTKLKRFFAWIPSKLIQHTFRNSTQYGYMPNSPEGNQFVHWHAPNPALNVHRLNDDLLTDKIYSDTPALDSGHTEAQIYFGRKSHIVDVQPRTKNISFLGTLQNMVQKWGAPNCILGNHAQEHHSHRVLAYLRMLWIGYWWSEPYYQHQNMFEQRYQTFAQ